jgi:hypothetical protein
MAGGTGEAELEADRPARQAGRMAATFLAVAVLLVGAFVDWIAHRAGDALTIKALVQPDFHAQGDFVKTVGALSVLLALVALAGLADRTGWLTRLAGAAALIVFVLFAVQAYRYYGDDAAAAFRHSRAGVWLLLLGGLALLVGGFLGAPVVRVPTVLDADPGRADRSARASD